MRIQFELQVMSISLLVVQHLQVHQDFHSNQRVQVLRLDQLILVSPKLRQKHLNQAFNNNTYLINTLNYT